MSSAEVQVNNEWLRWARRTSYYNIEDISKKMRVKVEILEGWENTGLIDYDTLLKLAEFYQRSPMIFFNDDDPKKDLTIIPDFRKIDIKNQDEITPQISFELRSAKSRRENLLILEEESDEYEVKSFDFNIPDGANKESEKLAEFIKQKTGMTMAQIHNHKGNKGLQHWIKKVEELGVLVFQFYNIKPEEMRGYALTYDKLPIIGINNQDHFNGKKFTLFHELAHILTKKQGISSFNKYNIKNKDEIFCNAVAAELLVPTNVLKQKINANEDLTDTKIEWLKDHFRVSHEVIIRRLLTLNLVSQEYYNKNKKTWNEYIPHSETKVSKNTNLPKEDIKKELTEKREDSNLANIRKATMALRRNGSYYTETVLSAYDSELITNSTMAEYLGVTLQVIEKIRNKLAEEMEE